MKIKKGLTLGLVDSLNTVRKEMDEKKIGGATVLYDILRNIDILEPEARLLRQIHPSLINDEYDKMKAEKLNELCDKNEKGEIVTIIDEVTKQESYSLTDEKRKEFDIWEKEAIKAIKPRFDEAISAFNEIAECDIELPLTMFDKSVLKILDELTLKSTDIRVLMNIIVK